MLDQATLSQLRDVFKSLTKKVDLVVDTTKHEKSRDLNDLLNGVASTSDLIQVVPSQKEFSIPRFTLSLDGEPTGVSFEGVPGGHEFTSLVLAILNSNGLGKLPDKGIMARIAALKGPIHLRTYISLSCENCPDVVQALNIMALNNPDFKHTMVDGGLVPDEVDQLKIQGVPSVASEDKLLSVGKSNLGDLLSKLEGNFGAHEVATTGKDLGAYEVVVVGAGPAGASAAIYSARKGLKTVVIAERMGGQVKDTKGIENLISVPYTEGPQLTAQLAKHMEEYDIEFLEHRLVQSIDDIQEPGAKGKRLLLNSGETLTTDSIIVATGAKWRELGVPGEKDYIGSGVAYCPHCDGPFYKGKDVAVVGGGNSGVEAAIDLAGMVKSVTLVEFMPELKADQVLIDKMLSLPNVKVLKNTQLLEVTGDGSKASGIVVKDRSSEEESKIALDGVFVQIGLIPNSSFVKELVDTNRFGEIVVDQGGRTNVKGIYAAGDVTTVPFKQIIISMGEGAKAALSVFEDRMIGAV